MISYGNQKGVFCKKSIIICCLKINQYVNATRLFMNVVVLVVMVMLKEAGPEIFVQSHSLIVPSGSLVAEPSNKILSVGKVITWSGPAIAIGGLLYSLQPSQDFSLLQKLKNKIPAIKASNKRVCFGFKKKVLWFNSFSLKKN